MAEQSKILEVKTIPAKDSPIIGQHGKGGVINLDGKLVWLRHPRHRYNGGSWGWENDGFTHNDTSEVGYHLQPPTYETTLHSTLRWLETLKKGELPKEFTAGIEIEGSLYDIAGNLIPKHDTQSVKVEEDHHPELINFTVETATTQRNGSHLQTSIDIALGLAEAVNETESIARLRQGMVVHTSVPEGGGFESGTITQHPYLLSFAPKVLQFTLEHWNQIPQATKDLYQKLGVDPRDYLMSTENLNWPVNALHVHTGIPQIDGLGDPRAAYACGVLRLTEFAKLVSFMLFNTRHVYGVDTGLADVRSIMRRLLASTLNAEFPSTAQALMEQTILAMENGDIHSPSRYPASGQHDRIRFRSEAQYKTVESIDAHMTPDLRLVLMWTYFNQIMNVVGLDALAQVNGDESRVVPCLEERWGNLFRVIPTTGKQSSFEQDMIFNREGYEGRVPWIANKTYRELLEQAGLLVELYGKEYPAIKIQSRIVAHMIKQHLQLPVDGTTLAQYLGIEQKEYRPNGLNRGIVTRYKSNIDMREMLQIQAYATHTQAEALKHLRDERDLLAFFGIM